MALLNKIKSATLMEALVATVLIIVVFVVASLVLNNVLLNTFAKNTHKISYRLNELEYHVQNGELILPYQEIHEGWEISIQRDKPSSKVVIFASNEEGRQIIRERVYEK